MSLAMKPLASMGNGQSSDVGQTTRARADDGQRFAQQRESEKSRSCMKRSAPYIGIAAASCATAAAVAYYGWYKTHTPSSFSPPSDPNISTTPTPCFGNGCVGQLVGEAAEAAWIAWKESTPYHKLIESTVGIGVGVAAGGSAAGSAIYATAKHYWNKGSVARSPSADAENQVIR